MISTTDRSQKYVRERLRTTKQERLCKARLRLYPGRYLPYPLVHSSWSQEESSACPACTVSTQKREACDECNLIFYDKCAAFIDSNHTRLNVNGVCTQPDACYPPSTRQSVWQHGPQYLKHTDVCRDSGSLNKHKLPRAEYGARERRTSPFLMSAVLICMSPLAMRRGPVTKRSTYLHILRVQFEGGTNSEHHDSTRQSRDVWETQVTLARTIAWLQR